MNNQGSAVYCNSCTYLKSEKEWSDSLQKIIYTGNKVRMHIMLGSVTVDGVFFLRLQHGGTACFTQGTIAVSCNCGYTINVSLGGSDQESMNLNYVQN